MLALRPDYVPLEYAEALRSLHAHVATAWPHGSADALVQVSASSVLRIVSLRQPVIMAGEWT